MLFAALAGIFLVLGVTSSARKSLTADEACHHIASGYIHLTRGDFAFSPEVPPLSRYIVSVPMVFMDLKLPADRAYWAREDRSLFSRDFLYNLNRDKLAAITFSARGMNMLLALLGGIFLFRWAGRRYSAPEALIAVAFFFLSPEIIAHSSVAATDMAAAVFMMMAVFTFWDLLEEPSIRKGCFAGVCLALALLSKFSALILPFFFAAVVIVRCFSGHVDRPGRRRITPMVLLACGLTTLLVLWAGYGFETRPFLEGAMRAGDKVDMVTGAALKFIPGIGSEGLERIKTILYSTPVPLASFITGVAGILKHGADGSLVYFMGTWSDKGMPWYYLVAFTVKTPIPFIVALISGSECLLRRSGKRGLNLYLFSCAMLLVILASKSNLQLGIRYILPAYPFFCLIAAQGIRTITTRGGWKAAAGYCLIAWFILESLFAWPDFLGYFNQLAITAGGGHRILRDSNIDWGQDLPELKRYMDREGVGRVGLYYFGGADPAYHGISYDNVTEQELMDPEEKVYAVSVQYLDAVKWSGEREPDAVAGKSIFVYDMRNKKVRRK